MNKLDQKLNKRKEELLCRTSEIFGIEKIEAEELFNEKNMSLNICNINSKNTSEEINKFIEKSIEDKKITKIGWAKDTYIINKEKTYFTHSKEFESGQIYIQNASSLLPIIALDPKEGEIILDMCAAPGGKTINIANKINNLATIIVNDENNVRVNNMKKLFELYKVNINSYYAQPAQYLSKHLPAEYFDKILLDAPCSGEGLINLRDIKTLGFWSTKKIKRLNSLQKSIISEAYKLLKKGGTLVYSTCTLSPEENEEVISWALNNFKDLIIENIEFEKTIENITKGLVSWKDKTYNKECTKCLRIKPNDYMEAFFVCKLKKL